MRLWTTKRGRAEALGGYVCYDIGNVPTVAFNIGEAFPAGDPVARFVTVLAMISNDANRSIVELLHLEEGKPDTGARKMMLFRQQAAFFFEAAKFITESTSRFHEIRDFIAELPQEAHTDCERVVGSVKPRSPHYLGDWLGQHRNGTFHYPEMHPDKAAHGKEEIGQALEYTAESQGTIYSDSGDELGGVRFGFADTVASWWLPSVEENHATLVALRDALNALVGFTRLALVAYLGPRPTWTFIEQP